MGIILGSFLMVLGFLLWIIRITKKKPLIQTNPNQITWSNPKHQIKAYDASNHSNKNVNEYSAIEFTFSRITGLGIDHLM